MSGNCTDSETKLIVVTGATGFIGCHLLPALNNQDLQLVLTVRHHLSKELNSDYKVVNVGEIDEKTDWTEALIEVDTIIHLAARAHQLNDQAVDPEAEFLRVNYEGTKNLVRQAIASGVKHFIFISSIGAMATLSEQVLTEESPCHPDTPYGRSKLQAEKALTELCHDSPMTWTIIRPTLVYGAGNPGNMERLIKLVKRGLPLPLGSIHNQKSFLYVGNLVDAIATCIDHPNAKNQTFIISDGEDLSTSDLIRRLGKALDKSPLLLPFPPELLRLATKLLGKADVGDRLLGSLQVDNSRIRQTLDWKPPYTVDQGLQTTADWFKAR
jgi:nucleoside-diphosphate-sugar epimerase